MATYSVKVDREPATGYEPPPRRQVLLDDPTGDDIAGDAP